MARGDILRARLLERIRTSGLSLTVHYPPERPAASGTSPGSRPVNPLTGTRPAKEVYPDAATPERPAVADISCLWYDAPQLLPAHVRAVEGLAGLLSKADCWAQVELATVLLNTADYHGDTVFTGCDYIEFGGHRFKVLGTQPAGAGHREPAVMYVWLTRSLKD